MAVEVVSDEEEGHEEENMVDEEDVRCWCCRKRGSMKNKYKLESRTREDISHSEK